jgi:hypothetical protein
MWTFTRPHFHVCLFLGYHVSSCCSSLTITTRIASSSSRPTHHIHHYRCTWWMNWSHCGSWWQNHYWDSAGLICSLVLLDLRFTFWSLIMFYCWHSVANPVFLLAYLQCCINGGLALCGRLVVQRSKFLIEVTLLLALRIGLFQLYQASWTIPCKQLEQQVTARDTIMDWGTGSFCMQLWPLLCFHHQWCSQTIDN